MSQLDRVTDRPVRPASPPPRRPWRTHAFLIILVGVLAAALLAVAVNELVLRPPPKTVEQPDRADRAEPLRATGDGAASATVPAGRFSVEVLVVPARTSANQVHVTVFAVDGNTVAVRDLDATLRSPDGRSAPVEVTFERLASNHFLARSTGIPTSGDWRLELAMRARETDADTDALISDQRVETALTIPVR
jgi:hypothetical protein